MCESHEIFTGLKLAFDHFNASLFEGRLPPVVLTLKNKPRSRGYFHADNYAHREEDVTAHEIALNPTCFDRSVRDVLSTLVHEMTHLEQETFGKPAKGGYHDKAWGVLMRRVGLYPSSTGAPGGKETGTRVSHYIEAGGPFDLSCEQLLATGFSLDWIERGSVGKASKKQGKRVKYVCPSCELAAWAKHGARIVCFDCEEELEAQG